MRNDVEYMEVTPVAMSRMLVRLGVDPETADHYWWYADGEWYLYRGKCSDVNAIPCWSAEALMSAMTQRLTKDNT